MPDLLTITLNPALDLSSAVDHVEPGPKLRLDAPVAEPGGGGINVARAARALGGAPRALAVLGGATGARIAALLAAEGVDLVQVAIPGETRQTLAVSDRQTGGMYRLQVPGPSWDTARTGALLARIEAEAGAIGPGAGVVLSGSQPPGLGADFPQALVRRLSGARDPGARVVIDTSGEALHQLLHAPDTGARPWVLRMDQAESEGLAGHPLADVAASLALARRMVADGVAGCVVLARGADGSVLATADLSLHCRPPEVPVVSRIGAGDSFTAAFALALARGQGWPEALVLGTAAAAAAVMTPGSQLCRADDVALLAPRCVLTPA